MALREVLLFPDPRLKRVSEPIEKITDEIRTLAQDMLEVIFSMGSDTRFRRGSGNRSTSRNAMGAGEGSRAPPHSML